MSKLITIFGATGVQGGSVVKAILNDPRLFKEYRIRGVTRDPQKPAAQSLSTKGVEVVSANLDDYDSVKQAVQGSTAVFAVTNYWEKMSKEVEVKQGHNIANACKDAGVKHLIWSALPNVTKLTSGALQHVEHFDSKAEIAEFIEGMKGSMIATHVMPGFYMQNVKGMIRPGPDGVPTLFQPWDQDKTQVALFDAATDMGTYVAGILSQDPQAVNGLYVQACSQWVTPREIVDTISQASSGPVAFQELAADDFKANLPGQVAEEMTENMVLVRDDSYFG